jgi:hypothetical protein
MQEIGYIFVLGYFASASLGTYVSSLGDSFGYRRFVIMYGFLYGAACLLMRSSAVELLVLSRAGGVSTPSTPTASGARITSMSHAHTCAAARTRLAVAERSPDHRTGVYSHR